MDQHGAGQSSFFSPPNSYDSPSAAPTHDSMATTFKTHDGAATTFTRSQPTFGSAYGSSLHVSSILSMISPNLKNINKLQTPPQPRPRFGLGPMDHSTEDSILNMTPRYPHIMNYMAPLDSFHGPSGLAYSSGQQPALDRSVHAPTPPQLATTPIPVKQSMLEPSSDDEQDATESKPKKARQPAAKRGDKSRTKVDAASSQATKPKLAKGGRSQGSRNFQALETEKLLSIIGKRLPIGGDSWQAVAKQYNEWAAKNEFKEHDKKSLKQKFDTVWHLVHP